ncbi:aminotransferase class III-fold pyridoxal phosphate-dependent enzyme [Ancylobacter sp. 6x-1]|uniref:Aminotransferase class III-fold pyridoxal phosphate-dependent enzyme n=1 Tax=Ancylobacter crimeensis TaxID=2579147 RepID=A0ABT0DDU4_9HYPH|nr:aminotransferase class III-fold pyridoxal phosphate-dependent enzyme [Ancylobacter crimeensis]MCK0198136.1 aminotransferase class III-fold pyridoxal phosphate-dependent enzyme [Ancylobacter crimeensis]
MSWTNLRNSELKERAARVIPGGMYGHESTALLPSDFPQFFQRAEGSRLWDVDGNEYIDFMCAYGPNLLGYRDPEVEAAVQAQMERGDTLTGPSDVMVTLAEQLVGMLSHAEWAMFCKNGTDATSMATVVARAHTGKRKILVGRGVYHGAAPWCTPGPAGILSEDRGHIVYYRDQDPQSLADAVKAHAGDIAAVFATPFRHETFRDQSEPDPTFAREARRLCDIEGAVLVLDEVRAAFRLSRDGAWAAFGVRPDLTSIGKVIGNGQPISALVGAENMRNAASSIFVTGSFWFSAVPMAAAVATLKIIRESDYLERLERMGQLLREGLAAQAVAHGFGLRQTGPVTMPQIFFADDPEMRLGYFWTAAAVRRGVYLHPYHNMFMNAALSEADIAQVLQATDEAFDLLKAQDRTQLPLEHPPVRGRLERAALLSA